MARLRHRITGTDDRSAEAGFTLIEVVASMVVMTIFLTIFTGAMLQLYQSSNKSDSVSQESSQLNNAFLRLDREIRYAAVINSPTQLGSSFYVAFQQTYTASPVCFQLRLANGVLSQRSWPGGVTPPVAPTWQALASNLTNPTGVTPFTVSISQTKTPQLQVSLQSTAGVANAATPRNTSLTFTALDAPVSPDSVCHEEDNQP
jgi:prepilin-type N-terminal cleavage/methylation domain-containing protein